MSHAPVRSWIPPLYVWKNPGWHIPSFFLGAAGAAGPQSKWWIILGILGGYVAMGLEWNRQRLFPSVSERHPRAKNTDELARRADVLDEACQAYIKERENPAFDWRHRNFLLDELVKAQRSYQELRDG